ncbi:hypothetical protein [Mammaliicoccus sciuri]|uniref:hypothetical protein n=1 Tax=Mammaliicoccus sciuri TaxID=1296 RepID=UPI001950CD15|nr:hypothetical protein [Mammaliicoccus sciuri]
MLIDKVKRFQNESFYKWFKKFCEDYDLKEEIIANAKKGYGRILFKIPDNELYRFRNIQFVPLLKEYLGEGFEVDFKTVEYPLLTSVDHFLEIDWSDEQ